MNPFFIAIAWSAVPIHWNDAPNVNNLCDIVKSEPCSYPTYEACHDRIKLITPDSETWKIVAKNTHPNRFLITCTDKREIDGVPL